MTREELLNELKWIKKEINEDKENPVRDRWAETIDICRSLARKAADASPTYEYPENLLGELGLLVKEEDLETARGNLELMMEECLTDREKEFEELHYRNGKTQKEAAEAMGITYARAEQIRHNIYRRLKASWVKNIIANGPDAPNEYERLKEEYYQETTHLLAETERIRELRRQLKIAEEAADEARISKIMRDATELEPVPLSFLGLSVSAEHLLWLHGKIRSVQELSRETRRSLKRVRFIRESIIDEAAAKLKEKCGIELEEK